MSRLAGDPVIWTIIVVVGIGIFAIRLSFIQAHAWIDEFPPTVEGSLRFVPPAVLAAIAVPGVFVLDGAVVDAILAPRVAAAGVATVVAWRTRSMLATILVGMAILWVLRFVVL